MNQRTAKQVAWRLIADVVDASLSAGWPYEMIDGDFAEYSNVRLQDNNGVVSKGR